MGRLIVAAVLGIGVVAGACAPAALPAPTPGRFADQTLTVGIFSQDVGDTLSAGAGKLFERATGAKLQWVVAEPAANVAKLVASRGTTPPFDALVENTANTMPAIEAGLIAKLNYSNIPNIREAVSTAQTEYVAGLWYFMQSLCYRADKYRENGIQPPTSIEGLFDPKLAERVTLPASTSTAVGQMVYVLSGHYGTPIDNPAPLIDRLKAIKAQSYWSSSRDTDRVLETGEAWLAYHTYSGCVNLKAKAALEFAPLNARIGGTTYEYVGFLTGLQCTSGGKRELCETFANFLLDPSGEGLIHMARTRALPYSVKAVNRALQADPKTATQVYASVDKLYVPPFALEQAYAKNLAAWVAAWNRAFK